MLKFLAGFVVGVIVGRRQMARQVPVITESGVATSIEYVSNQLYKLADRVDRFGNKISKGNEK